jgi:Predicted nucleic acid-binding protein, contains PIN domain
MTGNKFLLDTNIISGWLKGESELADKIDKAEVVYIPIIVIGELYYGAAFSTQVARNTANVKALTDRYPLLSPDEQTAIEYGNIKSTLRKKGRPIPENDIWIAATAMQYKLPLVTRDQHFAEIEGITLENW